MAENKKITETDLLAIVEPGKTLMSWLKVSRPENVPENVRELEIISNKRGRKKKYTFEVVPKLANTPKAVRRDRRAAGAALSGEEDYYNNKLFIYPYLHPKSQRVLAGIKEQGEKGEEVREGEEVSWVDLSGNGVVVVPGSLYVKSLVNYNKNPQSRGLANPYAGRSALIGRLLMEQQQWPTSKAMVEGVAARGASISPAQVTKAVKAFEEDLIVAKKGGEILLKNPTKLLDELGSAYKPADVSRQVALRLPEGVDWASAVAKLKGFDWAVTGESSVTRYTAFAQGGAIRIAVTDLAKAQEQLGGKLESVPNFANIVLIRTTQPEYYFQNEVDEQGVRWASPIQTWLELQAGDARQQDAAAEIRRKVIEKDLTMEEIEEETAGFFAGLLLKQHEKGEEQVVLKTKPVAGGETVTMTAGEANDLRRKNKLHPLVKEGGESIVEWQGKTWKHVPSSKDGKVIVTLTEMEAPTAAAAVKKVEIVPAAAKTVLKLRKQGINVKLSEVPPNPETGLVTPTEVAAYAKTLVAAKKTISAPEVADESEEKQK